MSSSGLKCSACGTRIGTVNRHGRVRVHEGINVLLVKGGAILTCLCGETRFVRSPEKPEAEAA